MFNWITWPSCGDQKHYGVFPSSEHLYRGYLRCHGFLNNSPTSQFHHPLLTNQNTMWPTWPTWPYWPIFDKLDGLDPCLTNCWPSFDQVFTDLTWPTFHQLFTNLTNFSPTWPNWPDNKQPTAKQIELNRLSFGDASKNRTYILNYNNCGLWTKQLLPIINMGISENAMSVFSLKVHTVFCSSVSIRRFNPWCW